MKVWKPYVGDNIGSQGVSFWISEGERTLIEGEDYVRYGNYLVRYDGTWFDREEDARREASDRLRDMAGRLMGQAYKVAHEEKAHAPA